MRIWIVRARHAYVSTCPGFASTSRQRVAGLPIPSALPTNPRYVCRHRMRGFALQSVFPDANTHCGRGAPALKARVLNAANAEELQHILGPWDARLSREHTLRSDDDDPELLIIIPFTSDVKVRLGFPPSRGPRGRCVSAAPGARGGRYYMFVGPCLGTRVVAAVGAGPTYVGRVSPG